MGIVDKTHLLVDEDAPVGGVCIIENNPLRCTNVFVARRKLEEIKMKNGVKD